MIDLIIKEPLLILAAASLVCGIFILVFIIFCIIKPPDEKNCYTTYWEGFIKRNLK